MFSEDSRPIVKLEDVKEKACFLLSGEILLVLLKVAS